MGYLMPEVADACQRVEPYLADGQRVTHVSTTERHGAADVRVLITTTNDGGMFGSSQYEEEVDFDLMQVGDRWLIESTPWQLSICAGGM
jgi:hypothetical protein